MPLYMVSLMNTVSTTIEVEADDPDDAREKVWDSDGFQNLGGLCHQCEHHVGSLGDWQLSDDDPDRNDAVWLADEEDDDDG